MIKKYKYSFIVDSNNSNVMKLLDAINDAGISVTRSPLLGKGAEVTESASANNSTTSATTTSKTSIDSKGETRDLVEMMVQDRERTKPLFINKTNRKFTSPSAFRMNGSHTSKDVAKMILTENNGFLGGDRKGYHAFYTKMMNRGFSSHTVKNTLSKLRIAGIFETDGTSIIYPAVFNKNK